MKKAWEILKRVDIRNAEEYERASLEDRRRWHVRQGSAYRRRLQVLRRTHKVTNEESPMYKEMVELQELLRFHDRQKDRISGGNRQDFYSLKLETYRLKQKGDTTPQGNPMPYKELSQEVYETLSHNEKYKYHQGMYKKLIDGEEKVFHGRSAARLRRKSLLPTFASLKHGGKSVVNRGLTTTREEYENMSNEDKRKYHKRMESRARKKGDIDLAKFYKRMGNRLAKNIPRPVFYSPEDEGEQ
jgi:hypothetical protein